jgi:hypothetical protein
MLKFSDLRLLQILESIQGTDLLEKLKPSDPTGKYIHDFVHSDNPKFAGKSKKERIRMALGAKYGAMRKMKEETEQIDEAGKTNTKYSVDKIHKHPDGAHTVKIKYTHPNGETGHHIHSGKPAYVAKLVKNRYNLSV